MGLNTTVVILNDGLAQIENDPDFGKNLVQAIQNLASGKKQTLYASDGRCSGNVGEVVETHHADFGVSVRVGGNCGVILD